MTAARDRVRRCRDRRRRNVILVNSIELKFDQRDGLVDAGFLKEWDAEEPAAIRRAVETLLAQMVREEP